MQLIPYSKIHQVSNSLALINFIYFHFGVRSISVRSRAAAAAVFSADFISEFPTSDSL